MMIMEPTTNTMNKDTVPPAQEDLRKTAIESVIGISHKELATRNAIAVRLNEHIRTTLMNKAHYFMYDLIQEYYARLEFAGVKLEAEARSSHRQATRDLYFTGNHRCINEPIRPPYNADEIRNAVDETVVEIQREEKLTFFSEMAHYAELEKHKCLYNSEETRELVFDTVRRLSEADKLVETTRGYKYECLNLIAYEGASLTMSQEPMDIYTVDKIKQMLQFEVTEAMDDEEFTALENLAEIRDDQLALFSQYRSVFWNATETIQEGSLSHPAIWNILSYTGIQCAPEFNNCSAPVMEEIMGYQKFYHSIGETHRGHEFDAPRDSTARYLWANYDSGIEAYMVEQDTNMVHIHKALEAMVIALTGRHRDAMDYDSVGQLRRMLGKQINTAEIADNIMPSVRGRFRESETFMANFDGHQIMRILREDDLDKFLREEENLTGQDGLEQLEEIMTINNAWCYAKLVLYNSMTLASLNSVKNNTDDQAYISHMGQEILKPEEWEREALSNAKSISLRLEYVSRNCFGFNNKMADHARELESIFAAKYVYQPKLGDRTEVHRAPVFENDLDERMLEYASQAIIFNLFRNIELNITYKGNTHRRENTTEQWYEDSEQLRNQMNSKIPGDQESWKKADFWTDYIKQAALLVYKTHNELKYSE